MFKGILLACAFSCAAIAPGFAKNLAIPAKEPVATIVIPDKWKLEEIEYGYSAKSPDGDVFFSVEYAVESRVDKMFAETKTWMKENKIKTKDEGVQKETEIGGLPAKIFTYKATDENGDTQIDFVTIPAGKRLILITIWASDEEREANKADIIAIQKSLKAIK